LENIGKEVNILGIETSCDETAAAVVADGRTIKSSVVASQEALHEKFGGVVPEIASRAHIENIYPVVSQALEEAGAMKETIDAVAVANQPGLVISLIVGVTAAKTLALAWGKPLIAVNHVHAHLQSAMLAQDNLDLPAVALVVSGGHTSLYDCESGLDLTLIGSTIDDAAGEAFDKVAAILKLGYPGGPSIERIAKQDMKGENRVEAMSESEKADIAASFQAAVVDVLVAKTKRAAEKIKAKTVLLGGGVAANTSLRKALTEMCDTTNRRLLIAPKRLCTDNAVMVASLGYHKFKAGRFADLALEAVATS